MHKRNKDRRSGAEVHPAMVGLPLPDDIKRSQLDGLTFVENELGVAGKKHHAILSRRCMHQGMTAGVNPAMFDPALREELIRDALPIVGSQRFVWRRQDEETEEGRTGGRIKWNTTLRVKALPDILVLPRHEIEHLFVP